MGKKFNILKGEITVEVEKGEKKPFPWCAIILFYIISLIATLVASNYFEESISDSFLWIVFGNLSITVITQGLHLWLKESPHVFEDPESVIIRSTAGMLELVFYTFTITFGWFTILAGFLFMKGISVWKNESNPSQEGASAGILRIAVVLSLFIAIIISVHLNSSQDFLESNMHKAVQKIMENNSPIEY